MSMESVKRLASEITGSVTVERKSSGTQPSGTGVAKAPSFPRPASPLVQPDPLDELPLQLREIVGSGTAYLISWLRFSRQPIDPRYEDRALSALKILKAKVAPLARPASAEEILNVLEAVAQLFQVELPEEDGLMIYTLSLKDIPAQLLKRAAAEVCRTHQYKTMPTPVEFRRPVKDEAAMLTWLDKKLDVWIAQLQESVASHR